MREAEWLASRDPEAMLRFLADKAGEPTFRKFALECCRRAEHLLTGEAARETLGGLARMAAGHYQNDPDASDPLEGTISASKWAALAAATTDPVAAGAYADGAVCAAVYYENTGAELRAKSYIGRVKEDRARFDAERAAQADLLRSIADPFGGPK